jgi:hypothetical protein
VGRNIGLVQTGAIGDIVIALPIARYWIDQGHRVFWPIDSRFFDFFREAAPEVDFLPVDVKLTGTGNAVYFVEAPKLMLSAVHCEEIHILYSFLGAYPLQHRNLAHSLKFDEYKYAVTGVPFKEKWNLRLHENAERQADLRRQLQLPPGAGYIVVHEEGGPGSNFHRPIELAPDQARDRRIVKIQQLTSSPFDWIDVFRGAAEIHVVDSLHANLIEQLRLPVRKTLYLRSDVRLTPVFSDGWQFR